VLRFGDARHWRTCLLSVNGQAQCGAIISDAQGNPWSAASCSFVAAAPGLHAKVIDVLSDITAE
jgi:hypothetical protein